MTYVAVPEGFGTAGRLGNQMLQVAATVGIACQSPETTPAIPASWPYRDVFSIPEGWYLGDSAIAAALGEGDALRADECLGAAHLPDWVRPYLQDVALWSDYRSMVRAMFKLNERAQGPVVHGWRDLLGIHDDTLRTLGVHVRRGDNVTNQPGSINLLPESYYRDAIAAAGAYDVLVVISDDPNWCHDHLTDLKPHVYHGTPRPKEYTAGYTTGPVLDWIDLALLARCDRVVCSNSTYAWWGAFLSDDPSPIYPSYWVGHQLIERGQDPTLLFPEDWGWQCVQTRGACEVTHHGDRVVGSWEDGTPGDVVGFEIPYDGAAHAPETIEWSALHCAHLVDALRSV